MKKSITININNLIESFSIVGQTIESKETIKQVVTEALLEAVNSVNISEPKTDKTVHIVEVARIELPITSNNKKEILDIISNELEKHPDMHHFNGYFSGFAKGKETICHEDAHQPHSHGT